MQLTIVLIWDRLFSIQNNPFLIFWTHYDQSYQCTVKLQWQIQLKCTVKLAIITTLWHDIRWNMYRYTTLDFICYCLFMTLSICTSEYHVTKRNIIYADFEKSLFNWTIPVKYTGTECQVLFRKFWVIIRNVVGKSG